MFKCFSMFHVISSFIRKILLGFELIDGQDFHFISANHEGEKAFKKCFLIVIVDSFQNTHQSRDIFCDGMAAGASVLCGIKSKVSRRPK